jgi:hypothetical protein
MPFSRYWNDEMKDFEMSGARDAHARDEKCVQNFVGKGILKVNDHSEN